MESKKIVSIKYDDSILFSKAIFDMLKNNVLSSQRRFITFHPTENKYWGRDKKIHEL